MTVQADTNKIIYESDGVTQSWEFNFITYEVDWISVLVASEPTDLPFTVELNQDQNINPGGFVNFTDEVVPDGRDFVIIRVLPLEQQIDYTTYDDFPAETHERGLDTGILIDQQLQETIDRCYKAPIGSEPGFDFDFPDYDPGKLIGWSETERILENSQYSFQDFVNEADRAIAAANESQGSANQSAASAVLSEKWAAEEEDVPVDGDLFSARHYAIKAYKARAGLNLLAPIRADNDCPKPGDDPGDCVEPDIRNPSQRFPTRIFSVGDFFIAYTEGDMLLQDPTDPGGETVQFIEVGDYIIYVEEARDSDGDLILAEGWYSISGLIRDDLIFAANVIFDDTGTTIKGNTVQLWNQAADDIIIANQSAVASQGTRITTLEGQVSTLQGQVSALETTVQSLQSQIDALVSGKMDRSDFLRTGDRLDINNVPTP